MQRSRVTHMFLLQYQAEAIVTPSWDGLLVNAPYHVLSLEPFNSEPMTSHDDFRH